MESKSVGLAGIVGMLSLCLAVPAFAQTAATVDFTNAPDGIYDPYQGTVTIGGVAVNNNDAIVCDDDTHDISAPESWNATAIQVSTLNSGNIGDTFFGSTGPMIGVSGYTELAAIAYAILTGQTSLAGVTGLNDTELSQALWIITYGSTPSNIGTVDPKVYTLITDLGTASLSLSNYSDLYVLTPTTNYEIGNESYPYGVPQEMFTLVPEGGAAVLYLLIAGIACFGAGRLGLGGRAIA